MIQTILAHFLKDAGPEILEHRFAKAIPGIVTGMRSKGLSPETASLTVLVRDALFRLFKSVVHSGDISDLLRDRVDSAVVRIVQQRLTGEDLLNLTVIVRATATACVETVF